MKTAGFTFIRNAILYDYPILEAIKSILPLCDLFVVAVGQSDDDTRELISSIQDPKIRIIDTIWDDSLRAGGRVLAVETDKAFQAIPEEFDWCFYIQGDECVHEEDLPAIRRAMEDYKEDKRVEGLLFNYRHFYGSYDFIGISRRWYRKEVRIIRNDKSIISWRDAQGFRKKDGSKLNVKPADAHIHHYGWVRHPEAQQLKQRNFNKLWHSDEAVEKMVGEEMVYEYDGSEPLERYSGTHPAVMEARIQAVNWRFNGNPEQAGWSLKDRFSSLMERLFGWRPGEYRNYNELKS